MQPITDLAGLGLARPLAGGALIGLAAALTWLLEGRVLGVSGITSGLLDRDAPAKPWRVFFIVGLLFGGAILGWVLPNAVGAAPGPVWRTLGAGLLVGVGTTLANGCTSGHAVCGVSRLSPRSLLATVSFIAAGMLSVFVVRHLLRGA